MITTVNLPVTKVDPEDARWEHDDVAVYSYEPEGSGNLVRVTVGFCGGDRLWRNTSTGGVITHQHIRNKGGLVLIARSGVIQLGDVMREEAKPADPTGTCHLVGCVGKGVHGPEGPHSKPSDPPKSTVPEYQPRSKIGVPDTWAPYEGGPTIPQPKPGYCLGFAVGDVLEGELFIHCSIKPDKWYYRYPKGCKVNISAFIDDHKLNCPNREPR